MNATEAYDRHERAWNEPANAAALLEEAWTDAGVYAGKLDSLDQGATIPIDTITVNIDAVRWEIKSPPVVFEGTPADLVAAGSTLTGQHLAAYVG